MENWFSIVCWNDEDIQNALELLGRDPSPENITKIRLALTADSNFDECMIAAGWNAMYAKIEELIKTE